MNDFTIIMSVTALETFHRTPEQPTGQSLFSQAQQNLCGSYPCVVSQFQQPGPGDSIRTQGTQKGAELHCS